MSSATIGNVGLPEMVSSETGVLFADTICDIAKLVPVVINRAQKKILVVALCLLRVMFRIVSLPEDSEIGPRLQLPVSIHHKATV